MIPTTEKLAQALEEAKAPQVMIDAARRGRYDDFKSESATPIVDLVHDLKNVGLQDLAKRAMCGEFDSRRQERR